MIAVQGLVKRYGAFEAVRGVDLTVSPGEVYALIGPNGAGKTTTLRCLATLLSPSEGTINVSGVDGVRHPREVRRTMGFVSASMGLYDRLTPVETLEYFGRLHDVESGRLAERIPVLVDQFDLGEFKDRPCGRLSTGQRQRVVLARSVVHSPSVLVLDEPTLGLDVLSGEAIYRFIEDQRGEGKAVLVSTHHMDEVELLADRIGVLAGGRVVAEGDAESLRERTGEASLVRAFIRLVTEDA